ncbi:hypothetical protein [Zavarzinella formosa]|uniref:hypothetical protein n=1 Tax=Zavarzinella formosa TaxID=360055 RepID=UPI000310CF14|nr:hypothetical protein [Zavarzinella formosa]
MTDLSQFSPNHLPVLPRHRDWRIGCAGAGFIMRDCHLMAYRQAGFYPVAIASRDPANARAVADGSAWDDAKISEEVDCRTLRVENVRQTFVLDGFGRALVHKKPTTSPTPKLLDDAAKPKLIAMRLGKPPKARRQLSRFPGRIRQEAAEAPEASVRSQRRHFAKVTKSYRPGLFACHDSRDIPRTNYDLEHLSGSHRCHERRSSGRRRASPGLVVRGSVRVVSRIHPGVGSNLPESYLENWRRSRADLESRRETRRQQGRFRKDPDGYLNTLENKCFQSGKGAPIRVCGCGRQWENRRIGRRRLMSAVEGPRSPLEHSQRPQDGESGQRAKPQPMGHLPERHLNRPPRIGGYTRRPPCHLPSRLSVS